jgi:5-methylcytosine-specific restriction endonuclease McrA
MKDERYCAVCGADWCFQMFLKYKHIGIAIHHIKPKSFGGTDRKDNLIVLCKMCHRVAHSDGSGRVNWKLINPEFTLKLLEIKGKF